MHTNWPGPAAAGRIGLGCLPRARPGAALPPLATDCRLGGRWRQLFGNDRPDCCRALHCRERAISTRPTSNRPCNVITDMPKLDAFFQEPNENLILVKCAGACRLILARASHCDILCHLKKVIELSSFFPLLERLAGVDSALRGQPH